MANKTSQYRGVSYSSRSTKKPWRAQIEHEGERYTVGHFKEERKAAVEVDKARLRLGLEPVNILKRV